MHFTFKSYVIWMSKVILTMIFIPIIVIFGQFSWRRLLEKPPEPITENIPTNVLDYHNAFEANQFQGREQSPSKKLRIKRTGPWLAPYRHTYYIARPFAFDTKLFTLMEADPWSGTSWKTYWSLDSNAIRFFGETFGGKSLNGPYIENPIDYIYVLDTGKLYGFSREDINP